jgi:O-antigen ligase
LGGSGWYRAKLIDLAIEHFGEWWFAGYGGQDPGWGPALGSRSTDITNNYIIIAVQDGILGVIAFCGVLTVSLMDICKSYAKTGNYKMKSWYWAFGSIIVMLIISFNSCAFFTQTGTLFYCILGMVGSSSGFAPKCNRDNQLGLININNY